MSLIPSVAIGRKTKRSKFHLPCLTHGTSEIGYVYPSYSRNLINNSHFSISSREAIRLSPLFVPTMGDLSLRTYHAFIPHNQIWTPFDAFLDKKPFAFANGTTNVPQTIPHFKVGELIRNLTSTFMGSDFDFDDLDSLRSGLVMSIYKRADVYSDPPQLVDWSQMESLFTFHQDRATSHGQSVRAFYTDELNDYFENNRLKVLSDPRLPYAAVPSVLYAPNPNLTNPATIDSFVYFKTEDDASGSNVYKMIHLVNPDLYTNNGNFDDSLFGNVNNYVNELSVPTFDNCDFLVQFEIGGSVYYFCYNFNGAWKRLRSIFLGLGYCFNPFDQSFVTPLKLLAFYRAYWHFFGVDRNINFQDTHCAKISRLISNLSGGILHWDFRESAVYVDFLKALTKCTYTCSPDYFSSSVTDTNQGVLDMVDSGGRGVSISSPVGDLASTDNVSAETRPADDGVPTGKNPVFGDNPLSGLAIQMALKMLRFVNRYTVVGSKIYDSLNARFGKIQINDESSDGVREIGRSSTSINIGAIFNQSDNVDAAPLGDFAGVGTGNGHSDRFSFEVDAFGTFISLTVVVPQMGYFQGMLRENSDGVLDSFEMFDDTYDACGWQTVRTNELVADRQFMNIPSYGTNLGNFGFQPRFTHMKVPFNRVIGDLSLPHLQDSMLCYTLDRFFSQRDSLPVNNPMWLRSGTRGNTNRIFNVVSPTDDHVIWQIYFDVDYESHMKSLSDSFDTVLSDDNNSIEVSHV